jgi:hypothetical protein
LVLQFCSRGVGVRTGAEITARGGVVSRPELPKLAGVIYPRPRFTLRFQQNEVFGLNRAQFWIEAQLRESEIPLHLDDHGAQ